MTGPGKQVLSTQNTLVHNMASISCSVHAMQDLLLLLNSTWISAYTYDDLDTLLITDEKLLHFNLSKSGQILHVPKTGFPRPSHTCLLYLTCDLIGS